MTVKECISNYSDVLDKLVIRISVLSSKIGGTLGSYHREYYCLIKNLRNNKSFRVTFHDSIFNYRNNIKLDKSDVLYSVLMDMQSYESTKDLKDFANMFGYDDYKKASKAYTGCMRESEELHELFTNDELETLLNTFEGY